MSLSEEIRRLSERARQHGSPIVTHELLRRWAEGVEATEARLDAVTEAKNELVRENWRLRSAAARVVECDASDHGGEMWYADAMSGPIRELRAALADAPCPPVPTTQDLVNRLGTVTRGCPPGRASQ